MRVTLNVCRALAGALRPLTLSVSMLTSWETKKPKRRDFGGNAIVSLQCQFLFDLCQCLAHKGGNPGNGTQYANFFILEYQNHKNPRPDSKSKFTTMQSFEENIARIANAVQVPICLLVSTSVYQCLLMSTNLNLNRCLCSHCSQCLLMSTSVTVVSL